MDPNANLNEQRAVIAEIMTIIDGSDADGNIHPDRVQDLAIAADRLAELARNIDEWIMGRGFLPLDWANTATLPDIL